MTKPTLNKTIQALADAAENISGQALVPRLTALALFGQNPYGHGPWLEKKHGIEPVRVSAPTRRAGGPAYRVYWSLADCKRVACSNNTAGRSNAHWSDQDVRHVWNRLGIDPIPAIARRLKRTPCAVKSLVHSRKWSYDRVIFERDQRLPVREVAKICRCSPDCVRLWTNRGMPFHVYPGNPRYARYFSLTEVRAWLATKPLSLDVLHPVARQLLRLTPADLEQMEREKQQESGVAA